MGCYLVNTHAVVLRPPIGASYTHRVSRSLLRMATTASLLCALVLAEQHRAVTAEAAPLQSIAVIGDSYTEGSGEGGTGPNSWPQLAQGLLASEGIGVVADVAAEGAAGYGHIGLGGDLFRDLATRVVRPDDALVVFFGSRNDEPVDPVTFVALAAATLLQARLTAPAARFLVIGPLWPIQEPPLAVLRIRDTLRDLAGLIGAVFVDPIAEDWFAGRPDLIGKDGIHPNDAGHVYMADKIAPFMYDQLVVQV